MSGEASNPANAAKLQQAADHKTAGNAAFATDPQAALRHYWYAVLCLRGLEKDGMAAAFGGGDKPAPEAGKEEKLTEEKRQLSLIQSNMAACYLKLEKYDRAYDASAKAIAADPKNVKAAYRQARALRLKGDLYKARDALDVLAQRHEGNADAEQEFKDVKAELDALQREIATQEKQANKKLKGFLSK